MANVYDVLKERGFVEQVSNEEGLRQALERPVTCYIGYDPSAPSLHAGSLLTIMAMAHMQRAGHRPIMLVGAGTGLIGDPSGRTEMRQMLTPEKIEQNCQAIKAQLARYIDFSDGRALLLNNAEWLLPLRYIDFLREIGVHFSVNRMLATDAYRTRWERGLSFIEFNYQILQAYDYLTLYRRYGCVLQFGGNDQWANILAGVDLIRRVENAEVFALTFPLLTTASGAKMGKTAEGAVWLDPNLLPPFKYYQYWINTEDADVERFFKFYTFLPLDEIAELTRAEGADLRQAKERLAYEITRISYGDAVANDALQRSRDLFGSGDAEAAPTTELVAAQLEETVSVAELFCLAGLTKTRSEARRLIEQGGAYVDGEVITDPNAVVARDRLLGRGLLLRAGKKRYQRVVAR
ncbi:MAG: tyrosine--tRNA ligase [Anaerolineales bacterium]